MAGGTRRLEAVILGDLERVSECREQLKRRDLMSSEIDELVYNFISPDIPSGDASNLELYDHGMGCGGFIGGGVT